jgi:hypothetical protein
MTANDDPVLELFAARCSELADRVLRGEVLLVDAADMLQSAAVWSGLADRLGHDVLQTTMSRTFLTRRAA